MSLSNEQRLSILNAELKMLSELESQLVYAVELSLRTKEYSILASRASRLKDLELGRLIMLAEVKSLQQALEDEKKDIL